MGWVILSIIVLVLVTLITIATCEISGAWDDYEEHGFVFVLRCTYWIDGKEGIKYYTLKEVFTTYDKLEDKLAQAIFNPYFHSAIVDIEGGQNGNQN